MFKNIAYSEIFHPSELGIILSYQCNAECKHCLYACGREWAEWMNLQQLWEALDVLSKWDHDFQTIQAGIDAAVNGDVVMVADGVYTGAGNVSLDFRGKPITVRSENGPENCIVDCEYKGC